MEAGCVYDSAGNVGIGTTAPGAKLDVQGQIHIYDNGNVSYVESQNQPLYLASAADLRINAQQTGGDIYLDANGFIKFREAGADVMAIDGGNVGIGTTSPVGRLEVVTTDANRYIRFKAPNGEERFQFYTGGTGNPAAQHMYDANGTTRNVQIAAGGTSYFNGGNVGIGTTSPNAKLNVKSSDSTTDLAFGYAAGTKITMKSDGKLGIGTTSPSYGLDVNHNAARIGSSSQTTTSLYLTATNTAGAPAVATEIIMQGYEGRAKGTFYTDSGVDGEWFNGVPYNGSHNYWQVGFDETGGQAEYLANAKLTVRDNGNVGIGTTSPVGRLEVVTTDANRYIRFKAPNGEERFQFYTGGTGNPAAQHMYDANGTTRNVQIAAGGTSYFNGGNVGIGTTSPGDPLHISSGNNDDFIRIENTNTYTGLWMNDAGTNNGWLVMSGYTNTSSPGDFAIREYGVQTSLVIKQTSGNVGIGTISPENLLHVKASDGNTAVIKIEGGNNVVTANGEINSRLEFGSNDGSVNSSGNVGGSIASVTENTNGAITGLAFSTFYQSRTPNDLAEAMRITGAGNVGIGTTSPSEKLEVAGNIKIGDSNVMYLGAGNDLQIYHDGTNSVINNTTGNLQIYNNADDGDIQFISDDGSGGTATYFYLDGSGAITRVTKNFRTDDNAKLQLGSAGDASLYHNGTNTVFVNDTGHLIFENRSDDKDIYFKSDDNSGGVTTYFYLDGGLKKTQFWQSTRHIDNVYATFGTSDDLQIYHDGSNSYIDDTGTGWLRLRGNGGIILSSYSESETMLQATRNGSVALYYDNSKKFETTSTGVTVTGAATATTFLGDLNGTINTVTTAVTKANATNDTTVATTAFVQNLIGTIPAGLVFQGTWNATTNTPTLTSGSGTTGHFYIVSTDGSTNLDGVTDWKVGDWAVFIEQGGTDAWEKIDNSSVLSGAGTGGKVPVWSGTGTSVTLADAPITVSGSNATFAGSISGNGKFIIANNGTATWGAANDYGQLSWDTGYALIRGQSGKGIKLQTNSSSTALTLDTSQNATFAGDVYVGTATTNGGVINLIQSALNPEIRIQSGESGATAFSIYNTATNPDAEQFFINNNLSSSHLGNARGALKLEDSSGTALTLSSGNATFAGNVTATNILTVAGAATGSPYLQFTQGGSQKAYIQYADSGDSFELQSDNQFAVRTGGSTAALIINSSQNATFAGAVTIDGVNDTYNFKAMATDTDSWFGVYEDANNSANIAIIRSDSNESFKVLGHQGNMTVGYSTSSHTINGTTTFAGDVTLSSGALSITGDGSNAATLTESSAGIFTIAAVDDIRLDATGDISLDAGGDDIRLKVSGTEYAKFNNSSSNLNIFSSIQDKAIKFIGNDNGTEITALTLNMADGGDATFAGDVTVGALTSGATAQLVINHEGGSGAVAKFMSRTNRAFIQVGDNDTNGYIVAEGDLLSIGRAASASSNNININASNNVGIGTTAPKSKLQVAGGIQMAGDTAAASADKARYNALQNRHGVCRG